MSSSTRQLLRAVALLSILLSSVAAAQVTDLPAGPFGGQFRDERTGKVWLDVTIFNGMTYLAIQRQLTGTGFRFATKREISDLLTGIDITLPPFGGPITCGLGLQCVSGYYDDTQSGMSADLVGFARASPDDTFSVNDDRFGLMESGGFVGAWVIQQTAASCDNGQALDFDCDGIDDKVVWRRSSGTWFIRLSSNSDVIMQQWGLSGDHPIAGDYDGNGVPDLAVWRPSIGTWFIKNSSTQYSAFSATTLQFGLPGDIPIRTDNDGDGRLDVTVWRPSEGNYYYVRSIDAQIVVQQWGLSGDVPVVGARN